MSDLVRIPLAHQVHRQLRAKIVSGELPSGSRLLPEELAEAMAVSQTPVKEALVRLEADGLIEAPSRRVAVVRRFTGEDVRELYEARILIELNALRSALRDGRITREVIAELAALLDEHVVEIARGTAAGLDRALALDRELHGRIVRFAGNRFIAEWHTKIMRQTHTVVVYSRENYTIEPTVREHREILDALASGRGKDAPAALERHLLRSRDDMLALVAGAIVDPRAG